MNWEDLEANVALEKFPRALDIAAEGWRKRRHAILADLIDVLVERCPLDLKKAVRASVPAAGKDTYQLEWLDRAESAKRAIDLEPLLSTLTRSVPTTRYSSSWDSTSTRHWLTRLAAIDKLPTNPRIARAFFELIKKGAWGGYEDWQVYDPMLASVGAMGDARWLAPLRALIDKPIASRQMVRTYLVRALPAVIANIEAAQERQLPLEASEIERCEKLIERLGGRVEIVVTNAAATTTTNDEATLLDLVTGALDDDAPREVIADYWLERGDPRGTFVTTQLRGTEDDEKIVRALLREHEKSWLGDLALVTKSRKWKRGFLDEIELMKNAAADPKIWESASESSLLRTVRTIHKGKGNEAHYRSFVFSSNASALREVCALSKAMVQDICKRTEPWRALEHLIVEGAADKKTVALIEDAAAESLLPVMSSITFGLKYHADQHESVKVAIPLISALLKKRATRPLSLVSLAPKWSSGFDCVLDWLSAIAEDGPLAHARALGFYVPDQRTKIIATRGTKGRGSIRLDIEAFNLYQLSSMFPLLRDVAEHITFRTPAGVTLWPLDQGDRKRLLGLLPANSVVLDPACKALIDGK